MNARCSARLAAVQTPIIPAVAALIRENPGTISLGQGVVWYGPPPEVARGIERFESDPQNHKYKPVQGIPELVSAAAAKLARENKIQAESRRLFVTAGSNLAFTNALLAIADPGDEVILQTPYYFNHEMAITMASCKPVLARTTDDCQLDPEAIKAVITSRTRAIVTISPNNPTGAVYPEAVLREVNRICAERGIYHIHDEAYEYFTYEGAKHFSPGSIAGSEEHTISLFSLSKAYGFASWRIGYMVLPEHLVDAVNKIQDTLLICAPVLSQFAAVEALKAGREYCAAHLEELAEVRRMVLEQLETVRDQCEIVPAKGAFYCFLKVRSAMEPMEFVERLVREHRVAVIPGSTFGQNNGCWLRLAYGALQRAAVQEGIGRFTEGLRALVR